MIKAGQALSSRPDLLPTDYLEELQKLQDRLPPFQNELAFEVVESELGVPFDQVRDWSLRLLRIEEGRYEPHVITIAFVTQTA